MVFIWALLVPGVALAQACLPRAALVEVLEQKYDEHLRMQALTTSGSLVEMFAAASGSWTIVVTRPDGMACPLASGQGVEMVVRPEGDPA
jgi:hypothetical protein